MPSRNLAMGLFLAAMLAAPSVAALSDDVGSRTSCVVVDVQNFPSVVEVHPSHCEELLPSAAGVWGFAKCMEDTKYNTLYCTSEWFS